MGMVRGIVLRSAGGTYDVETSEGVQQAVLRGRLKLEERTGDRVVVGDRVLLERPSRAGEHWTIEEVEERTSQLVRKAPGKAPRPKVIVANIDRVLLVFSIHQPEPNLRKLDRFLVLCESTELEPIIVVNKVDLARDGEARSTFQPYADIGYRVIHTSASRGDGIDELRDLLCGRVSALTGPSGVGKSSLLNRVQPGLALRVGAVSEAVRKGRHTTVTAELLRLDCGGYVADTPGLREVGLWAVDPDELHLYFPEFQPLIGTCRYGNSCTHSHEPGCAIRQAVDVGNISADRYESYLRMLRGEEED